MDLATGVEDLKSPPVIVSTNWKGNEKTNIPFPSMTSGEYVFDSKTAMHTTLKSRITTEVRCDMSIPNTREKKFVRIILETCFAKIIYRITV